MLDQARGEDGVLSHLTNQAAQPTQHLLVLPAAVDHALTGNDVQIQQLPPPAIRRQNAGAGTGVLTVLHHHRQDGTLACNT